MKNLFTLILLSVLFFSCKSNVKRILVERKTCTVVNVQYFSTGTKHTLQTDPEWHATTDCGVKITFHHPVESGDTLTLETYKVD